MTNFLSILDTKIDDIPEVALLPQGTYMWKVSKIHKESTTSNGDWYRVDIPVVPVAPYEEADDIDADDLANYGNLSQGVNVISFMAPTDADKDNERVRMMNNLRRFLVTTLGLDADEGTTLKELLAMSVGSEFIAQAVHRPHNDQMYVDVKNYLPLP